MYKPRYMPASTVIDSTLLDLANIVEPWRSNLEGKTVAEAAALYLDVLRLVIGAAGVGRRGMVQYTIEGQAVQTSMQEVEAVERFLNRMSQTNSGGPISLPVGFNG